MLGNILCKHGKLTVKFAAVKVHESLFLCHLRGISTYIFIPDITVT